MSSTQEASSPIKLAAQKLGISDKRMRGFIRSEHRNGRTIRGFVPVGQGNRYDSKDVSAAAKLLVATFTKAHPSHKLPVTKAPCKARQAPVAPAHAPGAISENDVDVPDVAPLSLEDM